MAPIFHSGADLSVAIGPIRSKWLLNGQPFPSQMNLMLAIAKIDVLVSYKEASGPVQYPGTFSKHKMSGVCVL